MCISDITHDHTVGSNERNNRTFAQVSRTRAFHEHESMRLGVVHLKTNAQTSTVVNHSYIHKNMNIMKLGSRD